MNETLLEYPFLKPNIQLSTIVGTYSYVDTSFMKHQIKGVQKIMLRRYGKGQSQSIHYGRSEVIHCHLPSKIVFHQRQFSFLGCLPPKAIYYRRSSSIKGHLPSKVVFNQRLSLIKGNPPSKDDCLSSKVIFHQRQSFIEGRLPSEVVFHCWLSSVLLCIVIQRVPYHLSLSKPLYKLIITYRQANRQTCRQKKHKICLKCTDSYQHMHAQIVFHTCYQ